MIDYSINSFQDAIDYIVDAVGDDFKKMIALANEVMENPESFTGPQATIAAVKLSGHRTRIGLVAQYWKLKSAETKKPYDRLMKDALMVSYDSLLELINCLKLRSRFDREIIDSAK